MDAVTITINVLDPEGNNIEPTMLSVIDDGTELELENVDTGQYTCETVMDHELEITCETAEYGSRQTYVTVTGDDINITMTLTASLGIALLDKKGTLVDGSLTVYDEDTASDVNVWSEDAGVFNCNAELNHTLFMTATAPGYTDATKSYIVNGDDLGIHIELSKAEPGPTPPGPTPGSKYVTKKGDLFPHKLASELIVKY